MSISRARPSAGPPASGWRHKMAEARLAVPSSTGFLVLHGTAEFIWKAQRARFIIVTERPTPTNKGPVHQYQRIIDWKFGRNEGAFRTTLAHELELVKRLMIEKKWPERALYMNRCCAGGELLETFVQKTCSTCRFFACTLVD